MNGDKGMSSYVRIDGHQQPHCFFFFYFYVQWLTLMHKSATFERRNLISKLHQLNIVYLLSSVYSHFQPPAEQ